jgi:CCR4-NOT transcriptional complex subunit CAF120
VSQDGLEAEGIFNQHNTLRAELQQPKLAAPVETPPLQPSSSTGHRNDDLVNEAGAMFFMQEQNGRVATQPARQPVQFDDEERDGYDSSSDVELSSRAAQKQKAPLSSIASDATSLASSNSQRQPVRQNTPMTFSDARVGGAAGDVSNKGPSPIPSPTFAVNTPSYAMEAPSRPTVDRGYAPTGRPALGRKPSGARAPQPIPKGFSSGQVAGHSSSSPLPSQLEASEDEEAEEAFSSNRQHSQLPAHQDGQGQKSPAMVSTSSAAAPVVQKQGIDAGYDDDDVEALAALAYLDVSEPPQQSAIPPSDSLTSSNGGAPIVTIEPLQGPSASTSSDLSSGSGIKSSFAPSRQAEERKKKAQAQQAAQQAAVTKPGRANGRKRTAAAAAGAWGESSDEDEEEEEDDEDEDVDSDGELAQAPPPPRMQQQQQQQQQQAAAMHQPFPQSSVYPSVGGASPAEAPSSSYTHSRPPRTLPQPPLGSRPGACCAPF